MNIVDEYIKQTFDPRVKVVDEPSFIPGGKRIIFKDGEIAIYQSLGHESIVATDVYVDNKLIRWECHEFYNGSFYLRNAGNVSTTN